MRTIIILILNAAVLFGAGSDVRVAGPRLGFVEQDGQIRPLVGIPGSAWTGPAAFSSSALRELAFSPEGSWAVALDAGDGRPVIVRDLTGAPAVEPLAEISGAVMVTLSPSGTAAAVLYRGHEKLIVASGLPGVPQLWEFDLTGLGVDWLRLAVSDGGEAVLATVVDGGQYWVAAVRRDGGFRKLYAAAGGAAVAFLPGKLAAVLADTEKSLILLFPGLEDPPRLVATGQDGVLRPVEVAGSRDGRLAVAINEGRSSAVVLRIDETSAAVVECGCAIGSLHRMNGNALFRLTEPASGTVWVLDADSAPPRVVFVPKGGAQ